MHLTGQAVDDHQHFALVVHGRSLCWHPAPPSKSRRSGPDSEQQRHQTPGDIIPEQGATSSRNGGRDHLRIVGEDVLDLDAVERRVDERAGAVASGSSGTIADSKRTREARFLQENSPESSANLTRVRSLSAPFRWILSQALKKLHFFATPQVQKTCAAKRSSSAFARTR